MNLHHLELFHAVVQEGSVSAAAIRLGTSQPSVSRQIRELEERTGLALLERLPRGVRPTEAGSVLFSHARSLFAIRDQARRALRERVEMSAGLVSLGASSTVGTYLVPSLIAEFRRQHPGPQIQIEMGTTAEVEERLREGSIEIGFVEGGASAEFQREEFGHDELVAVCAPGYFPGVRPPRKLIDFCRRPLMLREPGAGTRILVDRVLSEHGIRPAVGSRLDNTEAILRFVEAGLGVSFLPRVAASEHLAQGRLEEVPLADAAFELRFEWIRISDRPLSPATAAFLEFAAATNATPTGPCASSGKSRRRSPRS